MVTSTGPDDKAGGFEALASAVEGGRRFTGDRKVRLGDVDITGRLRFDALTRYTQDVSDDDTTEAELGLELGWVVRSTVVDQVAPARLGEWLRFVTFCSGTGRSWAERRLSISGSAGARYEVATLWICIDPVSGRPRGLSDRFMDLYGSAAGGRKVSPRLKNPDLADSAATMAEDWQLRSVDYDVFGHVNNAAYWAPVEHWLPGALVTAPLRGRLEYGAGLAVGQRVGIARAAEADTLNLWWGPTDDAAPGNALDPGKVAASASVVALSPTLYPDPAL